MKYLNINAAFSIMAASVLLFSCKKVTYPEPMGDAGKTIVKVLDGGDAPDYGHKLLGVDFVNTPQRIDVLQVGRDVPNASELNRAMNVVIKDDTAAITAYNSLNNSNILHLPRNWYTINYAASSMGGNYTLPFAAGEHTKNITITIPNATLLDPSYTYGLAFTLVSNDGGAINSSGKSYIFEIGAKNRYDGKYLLRGRHNRVPYDFPYLNHEMHMVTTGASSVIFFWPEAGSVGHPIGTGPDPANDYSWYGATVAPEILFDPNTDKIASIYNSSSAGPVINIYSGAGSGVGRYDAATKTIYAYWRYNNNDARGFMDTLVYIGPR